MEEYNWSNKTILIAEDEETNFIFLEEALSGTEVTIIRAHNGDEAVGILKKAHTIDLVLMDIKMPIVDGYEATKQIKNIHPSLPIVAQTAYAMPGEKEMILNAGCDDYIAKPILQNDLLAKINVWLKNA